MNSRNQGSLDNLRKEIQQSVERKIDKDTNAAML